MDHQFSYDRVVYPSYSFPQSNPDRLATMATYYGVKPADPENCRVLELACGDGTNLLSFAYMFPRSSFVGIDLSEAHITDAKVAATEIGVKNIDFIHGDILDLSKATIGEFDFIIAHGLYSWVPDQVREKVLSVYAECLAPRGVGYISYNVYPGCFIRRMIWEMLEYHTAGIQDPMSKVNAAIIFAGVLREVSPEDHVFRKIMEAELPKILERAPENIFHDELSEVNQPFYFHEFAEQIGRYGMQFLSEADPYSMNVPDLSEDAKNVIDAMGEDIIRRQQYIDFIRCRRFRSSLVCRDDVVINREPGREVLSKFYVESQLRPLSESFEIADESPIEFGVANGSSLTTSHPMTKAALIHFGKHSGEWKRFDDIVGDAKELLRGSIDLVADEEVNKTATWFLKMFDGGIVKFHKFQPKYQETLTERPTASACARWQVARRCNSVTSMAGKNNTLEDPFTIALLPLLDGSRDLEQLIDALKSAVQVSGDQRKEFEIQLPDMLDEALTRLADAGYLIA